MRDSVNSAARSLLVSTLMLGLANGAGADPASTRGSPPEHLSAETPGEFDRWVPALALMSGIIGEIAKTSVDSSVRASASSSASFIAPWFGGSLELMAPQWLDAPGRPRLFAHVDVAGNFGFERDVAKEGAPGEFTLPDATDITNTDVVGGQGSVTRAKPGSLQVSAGAGVAFTLEPWGRRLRIKPSVGYLRDEFEVTGLVHSARLTTPGVPDVFDLIEISEGAKKVYHGIGPGLEVAVDTAKAGPLMLTVFISGAAYRILGDRKVEFTALDDLTGAETATFRFTRDAWTYQGGVGLRFRWLPD